MVWIYIHVTRFANGSRNFCLLTRHLLQVAVDLRWYLIRSEQQSRCFPLCSCGSTPEISVITVVARAFSSDLSVSKMVRTVVQIWLFSALSHVLLQNSYAIVYCSLVAIPDCFIWGYFIWIGVIVISLFFSNPFSPCFWGYLLWIYIPVMDIYKVWIYIHVICNSFFKRDTSAGTVQNVLPIFMLRENSN